MANYLVRRGYHVKLLAAKGTEVSYFGMENEVRSLNPSYLDDSLQRFYTEKAKILRDAPRLVQASSLLQRMKVWLKAIVKAAAPPDIAIFYLPKFIREALKIIREEKIEILIVSSPPHSSQVLGLFVKYVLGKSIFLVVDYRDGWNTFSLFRSKNPLKRWFDIKIEKQVLLNSDLFIYQSPTVLRQINEEYFPNNDRLNEKSLLVRNGYTTLAKNMPLNKSYLGSRPKGAHYVLGYFGGIDFEREGYRNPIQLLRLLDNCNYKCEFRIYGNASGMEALEAFQNVKVVYKGQVPLDEAKEAMRICDGLLVFHAVMRGGEEVIPGKFYEYIDACKPILVYGPALLECGLMVKKMKIGAFVTPDKTPQDIKQLNDFFNGHLQNEFKKNLEINRAEFSREAQYEKLTKVLNNIC